MTSAIGTSRLWLKAGCGLLVLLCGLGLCLFLWSLPKAPAQSPRDYPLPAPTPLLGPNAWNEYEAAAATLDQNIEAWYDLSVDERAYEMSLDAPAVGRAAAALRPGLGKLRAARQVSQMQALRHDDLYLDPLLWMAYLKGMADLSKGDIETALDYLAAISRLAMSSREGLDLDMDRESHLKRVEELLSRLARLPEPRRKKALSQLDGWLAEQAPFTALVAQQRELFLLRRVTNYMSTTPHSPTFLDRRLIGAKPRTTQLVRTKFDRYIYFVRDGDMAGLDREAQSYWVPIEPPQTPLQGTLFELRVALSPARFVASRTSFPPPSGSGPSPLKETAITYNDHRLTWESWRLKLALDLYRERYGRFPDRLEQLVEAALLREVPLDPYRRAGSEAQRQPDSPLGYDGQKAWSVGPDGVDQKGAQSSARGTSDPGDRVLWSRT